MTIANSLSFSRILLSPIFFAIWLLFDSSYNPKAQMASILMLIIFGVAELTDMLDGIIARRKQQISTIGKLLDPFSDVFFHLTCFYCLQAEFIIPSWVFLVILWRELSMMFIRMILMQRNEVLAARWWGKQKSFFYFLTGLAGFIAYAFNTGNFHEGGFAIFSNAVYHVSNLTAAIAIISFIPYLHFFIKSSRKPE